MPEITLAHPADVDGWRTAARRLLAHGVPPVSVTWTVAGEQPALFAGDPADTLPADTPATAVRVPRRFVELADLALCHSDPERFALLYGLLWRVNRGEREVLNDPADPLVRRVESLERAVRREIHHMHAFVRFRQVETPEAGEDGPYVAWFEPAHPVVEAAVPFFVRRFTAMRWSILTPLRCAHWDGTDMSFSPGVQRSAAPDGDALDDLWRTYYAATFNPARVNPAVLQTNMPKRYWENLPEAALIPELVKGAADRTRRMVDAAPTAPSRFGQAVARRRG
ncbi:DNA polymerase [Azospirillum fermentarium]|uniref:TIGR03915 family putative DNA repair protein n=1 Tax=Azospirillum fermentarium TaxID=1233114 RepID=UPI00222667B7|nr:TIGR03915 family putative DNA repair protein [Azospirillum fermentarium]MCW2248459.1 DNA polymerase [Azospirillum fermentarium]